MIGVVLLIFITFGFFCTLGLTSVYFTYYMATRQQPQYT